MPHAGRVPFAGRYGNQGSNSVIRVTPTGPSLDAILGAYTPTLCSDEILGNTDYKVCANADATCKVYVPTPKLPQYVDTGFKTCRSFCSSYGMTCKGQQTPKAVGEGGKRRGPFNSNQMGVNSTSPAHVRSPARAAHGGASYVWWAERSQE